MRLRWVLMLVVLVGLVVVCDGAPPKLRNRKVKDVGVAHKGLVVAQNVKAAAVLKYHSAITQTKKVFSRSTLGFVTPW